MNRRLALVSLLALSLPACGGDSNPVQPPPVTQPPTPAASISATGNGPLVLHPSSNRNFQVALRTPLRIIETAGGSANWNFARLSIFRGNVEIERSELDANVINAGGFGSINANSTQNVSITFRFNSSDFDAIGLTLGFGDRKDNRQFTVSVPFSSFSDVLVDNNPASLRTIVRLPVEE